MTDSVLPSVATFDISAALQGRSYPEVDVEFYLDEAAALEIARAERNLTKLGMLGRVEEHDDLESKLEALKAGLQKQRYVYRLRGIPNKTRQDILAKAFEKYPRVDALLGSDPSGPERDNYYMGLLWQAMSVSITAPDGAIQIAPTLETVQQFRDYAPNSAQDRIRAGIDELTEGVKAGFEAAIQDTDFLSKP